MARNKIRPTDLRSSLEPTLASHPLLRGVSPETCRRILDRGTVQVFEPGTVFIHERQDANDYWLLCRGSVRVFHDSPDGVEVTVKIFLAPAAFAEMEVLTDQEYVASAVAVDRTTVVRLSKPEFESLLRDCPPFALNVLYDTASRFHISAQNERTLAFAALDQRLASYHLALVRAYGVPVDGGVRIRVKVSQEELAKGIGAVRRSVARLMQRWQDEGILHKHGNSYIIPSTDRLAALLHNEMIGIDWVAGSAIRESKGPHLRHRGTGAGHQ